MSTWEVDVHYNPEEGQLCPSDSDFCHVLESQSVPVQIFCVSSHNHQSFILPISAQPADEGDGVCPFGLGI